VVGSESTAPFYFEEGRGVVITSVNAFEVPGTVFNVPERFYFRRNSFMSSGTLLFLREHHFLRRERFYLFRSAFISSESSFEGSNPHCVADSLQPG
jgi:hypothetical protein